MKRTVITYGLISGAILSVFIGIGILTGAFEMGGDDSGLGEIIGFAGFILAFIFIYFGIRSYRDREKQGKLTFLQGLAAGCLISLIASLMYALTWDVYILTTNPGWYEDYAASTEEAFRKSKDFTEAKLEALEASNDSMVEMVKNPLILTAMTMLEPLPVGILAAIISALILRRKRVELSE